MHGQHNFLLVFHHTSSEVAAHIILKTGHRQNRKTWLYRANAEITQPTMDHSQRPALSCFTSFAFCSECGNWRDTHYRYSICFCGDSDLCLNCSAHVQAIAIVSRIICWLMSMLIYRHCDGLVYSLAPLRLISQIGTAKGQSSCNVRYLYCCYRRQKSYFQEQWHKQEAMFLAASRHVSLHNGGTGRICFLLYSNAADVFRNKCYFPMTNYCIIVSRSYK